MTPAGQNNVNPLDLSIVIPCLNEERYIADTLDEVLTAMRQLPYSYEIQVVDDLGVEDCERREYIRLCAVSSVVLHPAVELERPR